MTTCPVLIIAGTNRPDSNALKVARILQGHYRRGEFPCDLLSLTDLPPDLFSSAAYTRKPPAFQAIQDRVLTAAGLHVVTPEYNGSFPGMLKYFIDMLKFPESFEHKPVAFVGEAAGVWGGLRAVEQLQMIFAYRNAYLFPRRVFIPAIAEKLDAQGQLIDPALDARLAEQVQGFAAFAGLLHRKRD